MTSAASSVVLLNRVFTLKESSPFILSLDTVAQSSYYFTNEFLYKATTSNTGLPVIYLSFETLNRPSYCTEFIQCLNVPTVRITQQTTKILSTLDPNKKALIIIDSFNCISENELAGFLQSLILPNTVLYGSYHLSVPATKDADSPNSPTLLIRLQFLATAVFELKPILVGIDEEELDNKISILDLPTKSSNNKEFLTSLTYRRKSGRSLIYNFQIDSKTHTYTIATDTNADDTDAITNEEDLLKGLTTFNLTTSQKQKIARDNVSLPFLEAQQSLGSMGGAIVYEFEKDDDYDEDDPYEDPF